MNRNKKIINSILIAVLSLSTAMNTLAEGTYYLPDVTKDMSSPSYWTKDTELLMTYEEIESKNEETLKTSGTNMYDLKNQVTVVDGYALNESIKKSSEADAKYYLGWTYLESGKKATEADFDKIIRNTQNSKPKKKQDVLYGIATKRTELRSFPSDIAIWDDPTDPNFDYQYLSGIRVNEPVIITSISRDKKFYLAKNVCCSGWIPVEDVAICKDKSEWLSAWDIEPENSLVVWGDKVILEKSNIGTEASELMLTMGTVLELKKDINPSDLIDNRAAYNNYALYIPVRNEDGSYSKKLTLISENAEVSSGYLPLTEENIAKVTFQTLGNTYGWGGSLHSDDCSGLMRNIYKCFGFELARNTTWQTAMPMGKIDMKNMSREERIKILEALPFGTILYFSGHEMMYLGKSNDNFYVISSVSNIMSPENSGKRQRIRSVVTNTLLIKRANGNTWLDDLTVALVPYYTADDQRIPEYEWYHEGVSFCLKNGLMKGNENKYFNPSKDISWAEFLQILYNMEEEKPEYELPADAKWYESALLYAEENNLIPEENMDFNPDKSMTREEMISVLYLYAQFKGHDVSVGEDTNILSYDDALDISEYAIPAMQYALGLGIIKGKTEKTINPKDKIKRAEIAVILQRFSEKSKKINEDTQK